MVNTGNDTHTYSRMAAFTIVRRTNVTSRFANRYHKTVLRMTIFTFRRNTFKDSLGMAALTLEILVSASKLEAS